MILIGNRSEVVHSTSGHSIRFEEGKESYVPDIPALVAQCKDRGHMPKKVERVKPAPAPKVEAPAPTKKVAPRRAAKPVEKE